MPFQSQFLRVRAIVALTLAVATAGACSSCGTKRARIEPMVDASTSFEARASRVIVVSFDGLRPDAIDPAGMSHVQSLRSNGVAAQGARTTLPSLTLVSHASMISGVGPARHQIGWNDYRPELGTISVPTMFDAAKAAGLSTAIVAGKEKFKHFGRPGTVDRMTIEGGDPWEVADAAVAALRETKPALMLVHFRHGDTAGHGDGWMSDEQFEALGEADQGLGTILQALQGSGELATTALIITADHGGQGKSHGSDAPLEVTIPWIAVGAGVPRGELSRAITTYDTAATALGLLGVTAPAAWSWEGKSAFAAEQPGKRGTRAKAKAPASKKPARKAPAAVTSP